MIGFIGSVFSPYYAWARRRGPADPARHCALNVALYGRHKRWAMTERGAAGRGAGTLAIGPSAMRWDGSALTIEIDEVTMPVPSRLRGVVRVYPEAINPAGFVLDAAGRHRWRPIAPCARVEVEFRQPALRWSGTGYFDTNEGDEPLEAAFIDWNWSRAPLREGAAVLYDVRRRDGSDLSLALRFGRGGGMERFAAPPVTALARTKWRVARATRADAARVLRTLEDAPFYARSVLSASLLGEQTEAVHESLSLDRFRLPVVQAMLPFRMPRRG